MAIENDQGYQVGDTDKNGKRIDAVVGTPQTQDRAAQQGGAGADWQDVTHAQWKASGLPLEDFMKQSGLTARGYAYDQNEGSFTHPDDGLRTVDPATIPDSATRFRARALQ